MLDSHLERSNMGPVPTDFHEIVDFHKNVIASLLCIHRVFGPGASNLTFSTIWVGTKKMCDKQLFRFVAVSTLEVPYSTFSCPFKILNFRSFLNAPALRLSQSRESSVH